ILYSDEELIKEFGPTDTEIIKKLVNFKFNDTASDIYVKHFETNFEAYIEPIEGIDKLLGFIKNKGIKLGLFTGRSRRVTEIILQKLGFSYLFDVLITGDETKKPKPDPDGILKALKQIDAKNNSSFYVGDFDVDILASKAAGVISVLALWASSKDEKFKEHCPDYSFKNPREFIEILNNSFE
ncbi:MAG: HAD family hydrolase, partial [Bacillota bacterium]|nr:HAD family hydrolase [Bacillota bacterium]